jgi:hypothetical protein
VPLPRSLIRRQRVGGRRQRCLLYDVPESTTDSWGQPSQTPVQIVNPNAADGGFWFLVRYLQGNEQLNVRQIWPTATRMCECAWLGSIIPTSADNPQGLIVPSMKIQIVSSQEWLNIVAAENPEQRNIMWSITCEEHIGATS